jgi:hypothetical protein
MKKIVRDRFVLILPKHTKKFLTKKFLIASLNLDIEDSIPVYKNYVTKHFGEF